MTSLLSKTVVVIPHYNHSATLPKVVEQLISLDLKVFVVDDGSSAEHLQKLRQFEQDFSLGTAVKNLEIFYRPQNGGKGAAVKLGLQQAWERGFSHAIQVDADGQHQLADVQKLLAKAEQNPIACICGLPIYGDDAPKARLYGRKITNFWLAVNTLSLDIADGMCGFRLYPLESFVPLLQQASIGNGMDFDIDIIVQAHWHKIPLVWVETPVKYAQDGVSHFRGWADNWLISKVHARLFFTMLGRLFTGKSL